MKHDQRGLTSMIVTLLMIVVISLIVMAFAQVARREQRTAIDTALSTQAYYAAEAGISDAQKAVMTALTNGVSLPVDGTCNNENVSPGLENSVIDRNNDVRYTCLIINPTPRTLKTTLAKQKASVVHVNSSLPFSSTGASNYGGIKITWSKSNTSSTVTTANCPAKGSITDGVTDVLSKSGDWNCPYGVLRYDLVDMSTSTLTRESLDSHVQTGFLIPQSSSSAGANDVSVLYDYNHGNRAPAIKCDDTTCTAVIGGMYSSDYYINLRLLYGAETEVIISRADGSSSAKFIKSQVQVDATGKAQDVLRRVSVNLNLSDDTYNPGTALSVGDGPCKTQFIPLSGKYDRGVCNEHVD